MAGNIVVSRKCTCKHGPDEYSICGRCWKKSQERAKERRARRVN